MAKATPKTRTVTKMVPTEVTVNDGVTLELTEKEARALAVMLSSVGGDAYCEGPFGCVPTLRNYADSIFSALHDAGVPGGCTDTLLYVDRCLHVVPTEFV